jgi:hypothetical protein
MSLVEIVSRILTHKINEYKYDNGNADDCSSFGPVDYVDDVSCEIQNEHHNGQPIAPPPAAPQTDRCAETRDKHCGHQHNGPHTNASERFSRVRICLPDWFENAAGKGKRHSSEQTCNCADHEQKNECGNSKWPGLMTRHTLSLVRGRKASDFFTRRNVPQLHGIVPTSGRECLAVRRKDDCRNTAPVSDESLQLSACSYVP